MVGCGADLGTKDSSSGLRGLSAERLNHCRISDGKVPRQASRIADARRRRCRHQLPAGRKAVALPGDIRNEVFCRKLVADAAAKLGGLDILVNSAVR